jgi:hypothetical protein
MDKLNRESNSLRSAQETSVTFTAFTYLSYNNCFNNTVKNQIYVGYVIHMTINTCEEKTKQFTM